MTRTEKPSSSEKLSPRRVVGWTVAALAFLGGLVGLMSIAVHRQTRHYVRFVSPPLKDGTRYTVLYPAGWRVRSHPYARVDFDFMKFTGYDNRLSFQLRQWGILPPRATHLALCMSRLRHGRSSARSDTWKDWGLGSGRRWPPERLHVVTVGDPRSGTDFALLDIMTDSAAARRDDAIITGSFRVLAPGEPVPR